jgi:hypothetical protein
LFERLRIKGELVEEVGGGIRALAPRATSMPWAPQRTATITPPDTCDMPTVDDPAAPPAPRHTTMAGAVGLFGLFAGLCAAFALVVTVVEWHEGTAQARWPAVSALIERGGVDTRRVDRVGSSRTVWQLDYRVRYTVDDREQVGRLLSHTSNSDEEAAKLFAWARQHRPGGRIDIRYDPSEPSHAVFASADVPDTGPRTRSNLTLTLVAALACAVLLPIAKFMAARERRDSGEESAGSRIAMGIFCATMGLIPMGAGTYAALHAAHPPTSADFLFAPAGLLFVFAGVLLALPPGRAELRRFFAALLVTAFALTLDWVAFGPGERQFGGGISFGIGIGFNPGEFFGRSVFGIFAVLLDLLAAVMWVREIRWLTRKGAL